MGSGVPQERADAESSRDEDAEDAGEDAVRGSEGDADAAADASIGSAGDAGSDDGALDAAREDPPPDAASSASARACVERCTKDQDCWDDPFGGYTRCVDGACSAQCRDDDDCSDLGAQRRPPCAAQADCAAGSLCVLLSDGSSRCARPPQAGACGRGEWVRMRPLSDTEGTAEVCMPSVRCASHGCVSACSDCAAGSPATCDAPSGLCICLADEDCSTVPNAPACDVPSGRCVCETDADCTDPAAPRCNLATGACHCAEDIDCAADALCRQGRCVDRCEDASSCPRRNPLTEVLCE